MDMISLSLKRNVFFIAIAPKFVTQITLTTYYIASDLGKDYNKKN